MAYSNVSVNIKCVIIAILLVLVAVVFSWCVVYQYIWEYVS